MTKSDELVVLRDANGVVVVPSISRAEVKLQKDALIADGKYQSIVVAVVYDAQGRVIGQLRGPNQSEPGHWDHVSGAMRPGESPEEAAAREIGEELGCELRNLTLHEEGVNEYGRYHFLLSAVAISEATVAAPNEIDEVVARTIAEWQDLAASGEPVVSDFFPSITTAPFVG